MAKITFGEQYTAQLLEVFGEDITAQVTAVPQVAYAPGIKGTIPYVRLQAGASERPVLYVPGFTEGIIAKAPFAAALAQEGFDVTLPDQNRKKILRDSLTNKKAATYSQAMNYISVLHTEGLDEDGPVDIVTHSYGSLIFAAMARIARECKWQSFEGSHVVMLAPAGIVREKPLGLGKRWIEMMVAENKTEKDFPPASEMLKAGIRNFKANIPRTVREGWELASRRFDYAELLQSGIGSLAIMSYAEDPLYGQDILYAGMASVLEAGASWSVPNSLQDVEGHLRGGKDASHNDEQFNPSRVAGAVAQILHNT